MRFCDDLNKVIYFKCLVQWLAHGWQLNINCFYYDYFLLHHS